MTRIKIEDIVFWVALAIIVGIAIWKLVGSPTDTAALISIALFVAMSELALWKKLYGIEKRTEVGFMKVRSELNLLRNDLNHHLNNINKRLNDLKNLIKNK